MTFPSFLNLFNILYIRDVHLPLKIKQHVLFSFFVAEKRRTTGPNPPDEIKRIYSLYKGKTWTMTCSLTHFQAQVPP